MKHLVLTIVPKHVFELYMNKIQVQFGFLICINKNKSKIMMNNEK